MSDGWSLKTTRLSDTFSWTDFTARCPRTPMLLFAVTERGQLRFETEHMALQPKAGWTACVLAPPESNGKTARSEEHTSELQSLMRISYAVFCLKKKTIINETQIIPNLRHENTNT